jgi:hypothetical protein
MDLLEQLLDSKNRALWSALKATNNIQVTYHPNNEYEILYTPDLSIIRINKLAPEPALFTHELLHILIKQSTIDVARFYENGINHNKLNFLVTRTLMAHISNCLEHYLMYPLFVDLGYNATDFTIDFKTRKLDNEDVKQLEQYLKIGSVYRTTAVDAFIGKYFAAKNCINKDFNYEKPLKNMKKLEATLFLLLENFWNDWKTLDSMASKADIEETIDIHIEDLKKWSDKKRFC